jgi:phage nucleotide-binding protein
MARKTTSRESATDVAARVQARIKRASDLDPYFTALIYGRPGAGKTRLSSTAPNVLLIDVNERGTVSTRRDTNPWVFPLEYWGEVNDVYWYLHSGDHEYDTVAIDGVSSLQSLCMKFVLGDESSRDASRDPDMPSRQIYNKVAELMKTQITNFRNLPMNIIFTAQQRTREIGEEEGDMEIIVTPNCTPAIASHLEAAVAVIGHLSASTVTVRVRKGGKVRREQRVRRQLLVGPSERFLTKDRFGVFGAQVDAPDLSEMIEKAYQ